MTGLPMGNVQPTYVRTWSFQSYYLKLGLAHATLNCSRNDVQLVSFPSRAGAESLWSLTPCWSTLDDVGGDLPTSFLMFNSHVIKPLLNVSPVACVWLTHKFLGQCWYPSSIVSQTTASHILHFFLTEVLPYHLELFADDIGCNKGSYILYQWLNLLKYLIF